MLRLQSHTPQWQMSLLLKFSEVCSYVLILLSFRISPDGPRTESSTTNQSIQSEVYQRSISLGKGFSKQRVRVITMRWYRYGRAIRSKAVSWDARNPFKGNGLLASHCSAWRNIVAIRCTAGGYGGCWSAASSDCSPF